MASHKGSAKAKRAAAARARLEDGALQRRPSRQGASESARRAKACSTKKRYRTRQEAEMAVFACEEHGTTGLSVYQCSYCGAWHLTSHPFDF